MRLSLFSLLISLFATPALAGVVFEIETQDHTYSPARLEQTAVYAEGTSLKIESRASQQGPSDTMIFRGDRREMIAVDHEKKTYMVIDQQFAANVAGQLSQMAGPMKGVLDSVPPEQRAMIEQMTKQRGRQAQPPPRPPLQVRNVGKKSQVYGYPCVLFEVTRDGRKVRDVWVTNWNNINGGPALAATFDSMSEFVQDLTSAFPGQGNGPMQDKAFATMKQMGGFPVATREYRADGSLESETALRSVQPQRINPADLQPPAGYRPESMFGGNRFSAPTRR